MRVWSLLLLLALLPAAAGCAAEGSAEQPPQTKREESAASHAQGEIFASKTRDQARPLTEEEILSAYDRAVTACGWFQLSTLPCGPESQTVENQVYYRVNFRGMEDLDDLRIYLRGIFPRSWRRSCLPPAATARCTGRSMESCMRGLSAGPRTPAGDRAKSGWSRPERPRMISMWRWICWMMTR